MPLKGALAFVGTRVGSHVKLGDLGLNAMALELGACDVDGGSEEVGFEVRMRFKGDLGSAQLPGSVYILPAHAYGLLPSSFFQNFRAGSAPGKLP